MAGARPLHLCNICDLADAACDRGYAQSHDSGAQAILGLTGPRALPSAGM